MDNFYTKDLLDDKYKNNISSLCSNNLTSLLNK